MGKYAPDLVEGQVFGRWTVKGKDAKKGRVFWVCRCDCGAERSLSGSLLRSGKTKSCGCLRDDTNAKRRLDLTDRRFGRWEVVRYEGILKNGTSSRSMVWCRCDCGTERLVAQSRLSNGTTRSCGCLAADLARERASVDLTIGQRFGTLTVIRHNGTTSGHKTRQGNQWGCRCDCGAEKVISGKQLLSGGTKSCGARFHSANWKGGTKTEGGYIMVKAPDSPQCTRKDGYVLEHRLVMSQVLGRVLKKSESVHHKNGIRSDNRPENLEAWAGSHSSGQRISDKVADAVKCLQEYAPHLLASAPKKPSQQKKPEKNSCK